MGYLEEICDPEIPVLSIVDLGIVRAIKVKEDAPGDIEIEVIITSTYTGCPAMDMIAAEIRVMLATLGFKKVTVTQSLSPAWTTAWMSEEGKKKLNAYGIAPPDKRFTIPADGVACPQCKSCNTKLLSEFGSTACKALYQCSDCREPFDYFKCH
ncbi:MAG: phenylacetate-CoA oxygenase subunit PaaJ [Chitinophagaceae bacterium]|nr:phenylacetate-CoA oxygenase subunit PaaJ [Chitinophagaceae bacterium]